MKPNCAVAFTFFLKSANKGLKDSLWRIGACYLKQTGTSYSIEKAKIYCSKSSFKGSFEGSFWYGLVLSSSGKIKSAIPIFQSLSRSNHPGGLYWLGVSFLRGFQGTFKKEEGLSLLRKAGETQDGYWISRVALLFRNGFYSVPIDRIEAKRLVQKSKESSISESSSFIPIW